MKDKPVDSKLQAKLARAISKIGLSWATYSSIVDIREKIDGISIPTAAWYYNSKTKKERIAINPSIIRDYKIPGIGLVIKHELLHKAMYRHLEARDMMTANFALDCCIQKILALSEPRNMYNFCSEFYAEERTGISAICNCSLSKDERDVLTKNIKEIWNGLYTRNGSMIIESFHNNRCGNQEVPDPLTIYNKLLLTLNKKQQEEVKKEYEYAEQEENEAQEDPEETTDEEEQEENDNSAPVEEDEEQDEDEDESEEEDSVVEPDGETEEDSPGGSGGDDNQDDEDDVEEEEEEEEEDTDELPIDGGPEEKIENEEDESEIQIRGGPDANRASDKASIKEETDAIRKTIDGKHCPHGISEILKKTIYQPRETDTKNLKEFIDTWQTMRQVEGIEATIYSEIASHVRFDPFPDSLSRTGLEYVALGVSGPDAMPFYLNLNDKRDARKKVCCYFDTSPSMRRALPYMVHIAKFFEALEETQLAGGESAGKYVFSGSVEGMTPEQWTNMCNGELNCGYTTNFNSVIQHSLDLINEEEVDIIVILTDGESSVTDELIEQFNNTTKRCYRIYFDCEKHRWGAQIGPNGIESPLDALNGSSFTVKVGHTNA